MAKSALPTLLKLADKALEAIQQQLHATLQAQTTVRGHITQWQQEAATAFSTALAEADVREMQAAHAYQHRAAAAITAAEETLRGLQATEATQRKELQAAYLKQQQYSQLHQANQQREKTTAARKAQAALDDLRRRG